MMEHAETREGVSISQVILECVNGETYVIDLPKENGHENSAGSSTFFETQNDDSELDSLLSSSDMLSWNGRQPRGTSTSTQLKQGLWSKEEVELLRSNIESYCSERSISEPSTIIFNSSKEVRKDFYKAAAVGIRRPLFAVYRRVLRMYDSKNHVGKYTTDEMKQLHDLRRQYGNDWQKIGIQMGRSASSIKDRCRHMNENCNSGSWSGEEKDSLLRAVFHLTGNIPGENVTSGIPWTRVARMVGTRTERQCRKKWLNFYAQSKHESCEEWTECDDIYLANRLLDTDCCEEHHIDWPALARLWPRGSVRSAHWLQGKWWILRGSVQNHQKLSFKDICRHLVETRKSLLTEPGSAPVNVNSPTRQSQSISYPLVTGVPVSMVTKEILPAGTVAVIHGDFDGGDDSAVTTDVMFNGGSYCSQGSPLGLGSKSDDESEHSRCSK